MKKWELLEGKASETLSTAATSSCNLSDVCVYLESKRSLCLRLIRGRHELTLWISGTGRAGAIIHNLWWSCMKVLTCCQSSILIRSAQCASEYYFFLRDRIIITFYKPFFNLKKLCIWPSALILRPRSVPTQFRSILLLILVRPARSALYAVADHHHHRMWV